MSKIRYVVLLVAVFLVACGRSDEAGAGPGAQPPPNASELSASGGAWQEAARSAIERGATHLSGLAKDGKWAFKAEYGPDLGSTALATRALLLSPGTDPAPLAPALEWLAANQQPDGGIYDPKMGVMTYVTAASVLALKASGNAKYAPVMRRCAVYLAKIQADEGEGFDESSENYGGIGYGSKRQFTNMSTTQFAVEAVDAAGLEKDHAFYNKALRFLSRSQNRSESNDLPAREVGGASVVPGNDGGAFYRPGESKAGVRELGDGRTVFRSYGSMTYSLLKSYLLCDMDARDERVKAALAWMGKNFELEWNPGMEHDTGNGPEARYQGLYYYYLSLGRCLAVAEAQKVQLPDALKGWREQLARAIVKRQREDGAWVNHVTRWYEGNPTISTSYALIALQECLGQG